MVQDISVGHLVSPADAEDVAEASQVETIKLPLLLAVACPCLTTVFRRVLMTQAL